MVALYLVTTSLAWAEISKEQKSALTKAKSSLGSAEMRLKTSAK